VKENGTQVAWGRKKTGSVIYTLSKKRTGLSPKTGLKRGTDYGCLGDCGKGKGNTKMAQYEGKH